MKFEIRPVIRSIPLREYEEGYPEGLTVQVWVNPPRSFLRARDELDKEFTQKTFEARIAEEQRLARLKDASAEESEALLKEADQALAAYKDYLDEYGLRSWAWYSELWSQGAEENRWPVEEIRELSENEPALIEWLCDRSRRLLQEHREQQKKA